MPSERGHWLAGLGAALGAAFGRFERRVGVLSLGFLAVATVLALQLGRLTLVEHETHRTAVERFLVNTRLVPTTRGSILDRRGEVLAADRASWDVLLRYDAIAGRWATEMARRELVRELGLSSWLELSAGERSARILERQSKFDALLEEVYARIASAGGFERSELDRRLDDIVARAAREAVSRKEALLEREIRLFGDDARLDEIDRERVAAQRGSHVVLPDVSDEVAFAFQRIAEELPGTVTVEPSTRRVRPWEQVAFELDRSGFPSPIRSEKPLAVVLNGVADHILGTTRTQVFAEDLARRPLFDQASGSILDLGGYRPDRDAIGASGIERGHEDALRGARGLVERNLERAIERRVEPVAGEDITLTLDIRLQSRIQALFASGSRLARIERYQLGFDAEGNPRVGPLPLGFELVGAVVVLEVATGEIVAAVSAPTLAEGALLSESRRAREAPQVFRPFDAVYLPGSILKPIIYCAGVAEGVVSTDATIECKGHFFPDRPDAVRCWTYRAAEGRLGTHGPLAGREAIARSCNIYFYEVARRLGPERVSAWLGRFGVGQPFGVGIGVEVPARDGGTRLLGESGGMLPDLAQLARQRAEGDRVSELLLGIGQGPIAWTPLHAAQAFATIARGGVSIPPRIVREPRIEERPRDLGLPPAAVAEALRGLRDSVNAPYGTGHHITLEGGVRENLFEFESIDVWGKTGTATVPPFRLDGDGDGVAETRVKTDHAWFVGLVAPRGEAPAYAIAVLLEHGGSGGKVAGPMAAAVMRAVAAEGYLGERARTTDGGVREERAAR
jgi:penicillin-binding protein 2